MNTNWEKVAEFFATKEQKRKLWQHGVLLEKVARLEREVAVLNGIIRTRIPANRGRNF